jgi:hypothetical protein
MSIEQLMNDIDEHATPQAGNRRQRQPGRRLVQTDS